MWKTLFGLLKKESACEVAFDASLEMLQQCEAMFRDAVASLWHEGSLVVDIYRRDREINRYQRAVRRDIVTHLAVSSNPDINSALVLTAVVIDIERIGDYTKNIVELAAAYKGRFSGGELSGEIRAAEALVLRMFQGLVPALQEGDADLARRLIGDHQVVAERVEEGLHDLIAGRVMTGNTSEAVVAALYMRYLKRVSAHLKNVATSIVNPYYRIGYREKGAPSGAHASGGASDPAGTEADCG
ncbi:MAG: PhoU domain-containing protein [Candidatus Eisenbacteria bacterium]